LEARGVWIDLETKVEEIGPDTIALEYKNQVDTIPVVIWTVEREWFPQCTLPQAKPARSTDYHTNSASSRSSEIFALGDLADCRDAEGQQVPTTAQAAFQQADYAGWNLWLP